MSIVTRPGRIACLYWTWSPGPFRAIIQPSCLSLAATSRVLFEWSALPMTVHAFDVYAIHTAGGPINTGMCISVYMFSSQISHPFGGAMLRLETDQIDFDMNISIDYISKPC